MVLLGNFPHALLQHEMNGAPTLRLVFLHSDHHVVFSCLLRNFQLANCHVADGVTPVNRLNQSQTWPESLQPCHHSHLLPFPLQSSQAPIMLRTLMPSMDFFFPLPEASFITEADSSLTRSDWV